MLTSEDMLVLAFLHQCEIYVHLLQRNAFIIAKIYHIAISSSM